jgi:HNH endonuclease
VGRQNQTRLEAVAKLLLDKRLTVSHAAQELSVSVPTICYYARRLGIEPATPARYDWDEVQRYYDQGHSVAQCRRRFGMANRTVTEAVKKGKLETRPQATPISDLLTVGRPRNRTHVKLRLLGSGLKTNRCERCGIDEWRGLPVSTQLHHINGRGDDNRLENLTLLCPNCHSQTSNHSRKRRRPRRSGASS